MIPHSRPIFGQSFCDAADALIRSGHTASGKQSKQLENKLRQYITSQDAVAVDSGTSAITLALRSLFPQATAKRIGIPAYACASLLFAVRAAGHTPVCMDCDDSLRLHAEKARHIAPSLDAVILVHPFGMIEPLVKESWPCPLIEDIAQAAGAQLDGKPLGSFGDITIASFYATKPWGGAYGGMVFGSQTLCSQIRAMSDPDSVNFSQGYVGHHQLSDMHASLALCRLDRSQKEMQQRQAHMHWLDEHLPPIYVGSIQGRQSGSCFRYIIRAQGQAEELITRLQQHGIGACKPVQQPLHLATGETCHGADQAWKDCLSLPLLATMSSDEYQQYRDGLHACFNY